MKRSQKSQIKMGETIAVLVVFFILLMIGMDFYTNFKSKSLERKSEEAADLKAIELATRLSLLPEVHCSDYMCIGCTDAFDLIKLEKTGNIIDVNGAVAEGYIAQNSINYINDFAYSKVSVGLIYPGNPNPSNFFEVEGMQHDYNHPIIIYENQPEQKLSERPTFIPVNLFNAFTDECHFGILTVTTYET